MLKARQLIHEEGPRVVWLLERKGLKQARAHRRMIWRGNRAAAGIGEGDSPHSGKNEVRMGYRGKKQG